MKAQIQSINENKHFDTNKQTRVRCDASKKGLGACLEQKHENIWKPVAYASRFLNKLEERYSTIELELLAVVWSLEHFEYYLYGSQFLLQTDHPALLSALKENRGNKTYHSRLTRWVDRLLPFHFTVEHVPGKNMGFADYLSRNPSGVAPTPDIEDNNFVINAIDEIKFNLIKNDLTPNGVNAHSSDTKQVYTNDVIYLSQTHSDQNNAFSLNTHRLQSHSFHPNLTASKCSSQIVQTISASSINPEIVAITTRNNPNKETYSIPILKSPRAPNKKLQMETETNQPKNLVNSSTQTEGHSKKGRGLDPIDPSKHQELFTAHAEIPTPAYRENLNKVFNEEFIAEASSKELKPIIDLVLAKNCEDLKKVNPIYYRIRRDLFVSPSNCLFYKKPISYPEQIKIHGYGRNSPKTPRPSGYVIIGQISLVASHPLGYHV